MTAFLMCQCCPVLPDWLALCRHVNILDRIVCMYTTCSSGCEHRLQLGRLRSRSVPPTRTIIHRSFDCISLQDLQQLVKRTRKPNPGLNPGFHQFGGLGFYFSITSKPGFFILSFCCCYIEQSESDCVISIMKFLMTHTKKSSFHLERKNLSKRSNFLAFIYSK